MIPGPPPLRSPGWRRTNGMPLYSWVVTVFCLISLSLSTFYSFLFLSICLPHIYCKMKSVLHMVSFATWSEASLTNQILPKQKAFICCKVGLKVEKNIFDWSIQVFEVFLYWETELLFPSWETKDNTQNGETKESQTCFLFFHNSRACVYSLSNFVKI